MKKTIISLAIATITGVASAQTYVTNTVPDGGFEPSDPTYSDTTGSPASGGGMVINFPTSGGNPDGCAQIADNNSPGTTWGVWVIGNTTPVPLTDMGLAADTTYTFLMDMKTVAGSSPGGFKIESWNGSMIQSSGDMRNGTASTNWQTFAYTYHVAPGATGLKLVGLWGPNSTNLYDNVRVVAVTTLPLSASITSPANGAIVNTNFSIAASATVFPGSVTSVDFYRGATLLGTSSTAPYIFNVTGAAAGPAALKVVSHDNNGNHATSSVVNVTVASIVPTNTFLVDPSKAWVGWMNTFETPQNGGGYDWGSAWGTADLTAIFSGAGSSSRLSLYPTKMGDTSSYWYNYSDPSFPGPGTNGAVGNHDMEATMYVQVADGTVNGNVVKFTGTCITNTLDVNQNPSRTNLLGNGWTVVAFVKDLAPDYSSSVTATVTLTNGQPFSVQLPTIADAARHVQYGFITRGPNVLPTDYTNYGVAAIQSLDASPTNFVVKSTDNYVGFMNVFALPTSGTYPANAPGGYQFGSGWGTAELCAVFNGYGLVLSPNTIGDPNPYWYTPSGGPGAVGNKIMDASMYVEIGSFPGRNLTFSGTVLSNTLVSASNTNAAGNGWTAVAFIKDFAPDYSSYNAVTVPLTPGAFSINMITVNDPARHVQYGFETIGPDVWATDVAPFGNVVIANTAVLAPTIASTRSGNNINLSFPTQLSHAYTVQYRTSLTVGAWSTLTTTNGTGSTVVVTDPTSGAGRFYRVSVQ